MNKPVMYKYRLSNPCPVCGLYDKDIILSINPHKTMITPFHKDDLMPLTCGHKVRAYNQPVEPVEDTGAKGDTGGRET